MMKNILIVESKNDKAFFDFLLTHLQVVSTTPVTIFGLDELVSRGGLSKERLKEALEVNLKTITKGLPQGITPKIGILIDADEPNKGNANMLGGFEPRLKAINTIIEEVTKQNPNFQQLCVSNTDFYDIKLQTDTEEEVAIQIGCHLTNIEGRGNLDTLKKSIANTDLALIANCLEKWRECYEQKIQSGSIQAKLKIKKLDSEFEKLWVTFAERYDDLTASIFEEQWNSFYAKYDTLPEDKRGNSGQRNEAYTLLKERGLEMFDWDSPQPDFRKLCSFLRCFSQDE
jgi:hypothetical protein